MSRDADAPKLLLKFRVGDIVCAVPATSVLELHRMVALTSVARIHSAIEGILNIRGSIVVAVNVRHLMGLSNSVPIPSQRIIVVETSQRNMGLIVDDVIATVPVDEQITRVSAGLTGVAGCVNEAVRVGSELIVVLDLERLSTLLTEAKVEPGELQTTRTLPDESNTAILARRAFLLGSPARHHENAVPTTWLLFDLDATRYAVEVAQVKEVTAMPALALIPLSPAYLLGVVNIRGLLYSVVDLTALICYATSRRKQPRLLILLDRHPPLVALACDRIGGVADVLGGALVDLPIGFRNGTNPFLQGVTPDHRLVLNAPAILEMVRTNRAPETTAASDSTG